MLILALDTTTRSGSIALARDETLLTVTSGDASKTHAERLPADITRLLAEQRVDLSAIDLFGVAAGPGSFTGLRVGIATVQGLAFAMNRLVVPVSTLDALAQVAAEAVRPSTSSGRTEAEAGVDATVRAEPVEARTGEHRLVAAFMDGQRSEVFAALYRVLSAPSPASLAQLETVDGPVSQPPAVVLERWVLRLAARRLAEGGARSQGGARSAPTTVDAGAEIWVAGDGVARYRDLLDEHLGPRYRSVDPLPPLAPTIARIAAREAAAGRGVAPHAIRPLYVRRPDAELARERNKVARDVS